MTLLADAPSAIDSAMSDVVDAYLAMYTRHIERSARPAAAQRMFGKWYPILCQSAGRALSDSTTAAVRELIREISTVEDPGLELAWLDQFPTMVLSYLDE